MSDKGDSYDKWLERGERFGLSGTKLQEFVSRQQNEFFEREERALRRAQEREDKLKIQDDARQKAMAELREKELMFKRETEEREIEKLKLQMQIKEMAPDAPVIPADCIPKGLRPKLPKFDENKDDMDAFLERFERFAESQLWPEAQWAVSLSPLLTGKGLQVYSSMPSTEASNYSNLKTALLKRYQLTEDGFRSKFRNSKPESGETVFQFVARLRRYFTRWVDLTEVEKGYEGLSDLLIREQFIGTCSENMRLFLRERVPKSVQEMTKLAEQYMEAHGGSITVTKKQQCIEKPLSRPTTQPTRNSVMQQIPSNKDKNCFYCNRKGHVIAECRVRERDMKKQSAAAGYSRSDVCDWRQGDQKKSERYFKKEGKKEDTVPKTVGLCTIVPKDKDLLMSCIDQGKLKLANDISIPYISGACNADGKVKLSEVNMPVYDGFVNGEKVRFLQDTGCSTAVIRESLVQREQCTGKFSWCVLMDGTIKKCPLAKIQVDCPFYRGEVEAMVMENPIYDLVLGNAPGVSKMPDENWGKQGENIAAVVTRAQAKKSERSIKPLNVAHVDAPLVNAVTLEGAQHEDSSLNKLWDLAQSGEMQKTRGNQIYKYEVKNSILYRVYNQVRGSTSVKVKQIVVPTPYRKQLMKLAHETIVGGHMGIRKTSDRITSSFHWPGIISDITRFCRSCDVCQRTVPKGKVSKVPLGTMPLIDEPFKRIAVDLIGPVAPVSEHGNRYILTVVDFATRYPEAVALPKIETERVAEALLDIFSRVGFPKEILSDRGGQFTSDMMAEVCRLVSIKQLFTTAWHPMCNGLCEKMNGTLKSMLKRMCQERPKDWDRYLPAVLFAYREVPQVSTGFSPFELLYGRTVRGPMQVLKELWTKSEEPELQTTYQYVFDLRNKLEETCQVARKSLEEAQGVYKNYYDRKGRNRRFDVGQKVLVLLPTEHNKLTLQWKGPYEIIDVINKMDYKINVGGKTKIYHANLLKRYLERQEGDTIQTAGIAVIEAECHDEEGVVDDEQLLDISNLSGSETYRAVKYNPLLTERQKKEAKTLVKEFQHIFTENPGSTHLAEHRIETTTSEPVRVKQYPVPYAVRNSIDEEVSKMLKADIIEPSTSAYNAPVLLVRKKDKTTRFCVDFRRLNSVTKFDTEPMGNIEDILTRFDKDVYFSKIDLSKGFWQIPVAKDCRHMTAFTTSTGAYQFKKTPFGLVNSPATFNKMMRKLLSGAKDIEHYVDDIMAHTLTWEGHLTALRELFSRVSSAGLTIKPSKCMIGFGEIEFVGHTVGNGKLEMEEEKVTKIKNAPQPKTKKQVRSFLGLTGFYRKFIPNYAQIASPLTDLTKKGQPTNVHWSSKAQTSFETLKRMLTESPILRLPDFTRVFVVQTDASDSGVGACLLQEFDDGKFPIAYASKKLLARERNYSTIERECLALIFAIKKFEMYLYGKEFILHTDHRPLSYIQKCRVENTRIMRWSLFLQNYRFRIEAIKGSDNVGGDYLSRL